MDFSCGIDSVNDNENFTVERSSVESILASLKSGVGLDISKNHTGVCVWHNNKVEVFGFAVCMDYDKNDYSAEAKMRLKFKEQIYEILKDYDFEVCIIEDCYGGVNFDTTRKLLALNCVVDELVLEGRLKINNLYRFKEAEWLSDFRTVIKLGNKLNSKFECQEILRYLNFDFLVKNDNLIEARKKDIFFEDICDATGQLCSLAIRLNHKEKEVKKSSLGLSNIQMYFLEDSDDIYTLNDKVIDKFNLINPYFDGKLLEKTIIDLALNNSNNVICLYVDTKDLGTFGIRNNFKFFSQGFGFLLFYNKNLRKRC